MGVMERLLKRRCSPLEIDGEKIYCRCLTIAEASKYKNLPEASRYAYAIGKALCNDDGSPVFEQGRDEGDEPFLQRMERQLGDVGQDVLMELMEHISKLTSVPSRETLQKN